MARSHAAISRRCGERSMVTEMCRVLGANTEHYSCSCHDIYHHCVRNFQDGVTNPFLTIVRCSWRVWTRSTEVKCPDGMHADDSNNRHLKSSVRSSMSIILRRIPLSSFITISVVISVAIFDKSQAARSVHQSPLRSRFDAPEIVVEKGLNARTSSGRLPPRRRPLAAGITSVGRDVVR